jgi:hypothetical protein
MAVASAGKLLHRRGACFLQMIEQTFIGFHFGISLVVNKITSLVSPHRGRRRKHVVPRERYSDDVVLGRAGEFFRATPCSSASAT